MTLIAAPSRTASGESGFGARHALILLVLMWASRLLGLGGLLSGNIRAEIAINFHTGRMRNTRTARRV
ncbi:hypothetical protein [Parafrankia sp. EUN1f]|uniref:hypothetical protein n=1 Tax=Parafrankia sp. EUN1f TaxID=102897 RepID=UPI0001C46B73|nr:hypothetical protein [Parafrankia sp. EUN1f]EFC83093.1 hypothetical protein FrEUN1fDRAFT_3765 [Parafrankia sp. EUN1f]